MAEQSVNETTEEVMEDVVEADIKEETDVEEAQEEVTQEEVTPESEDVEEEDAEESGDSDEADEKQKEGGKFFKKKKDKKDEKIEELNDKYTRLFAEFDNFRKRSEKEKSAMFEVGAKAIIEKILPIVDNFERGLAGLTEEEKSSGFAEGMEMVYKQLMTAFADAGVTPIESLNQEFDPNLHNAVMHVEDDSVGENIIVEEFQKGYMYRESVVRHSMVKVAN